MSAVVRYLVDDVDACIPFYEALGFTVAERWGPPFAILRRGSLSLWVSGPGTSASKPLNDGSQPVPGGWNRIVIEVEDIQLAVEQARNHGAKLRSELISGPGGHQVLLEDPAGNPVELFQPR
jgi:catechol 2,3-dioxygenase-like lactoylglutathione lyase family enzyme